MCVVFFLFVYAEMQVVDTKFEAFTEKTEEIKNAMLKKKEKPSVIRKQIRSMKKKPTTPQYNGASIRIEHGGCLPSHDTAAATMRNMHDENNQPQRPLMVSCRSSHDVFAPEDRLRDPNQDERKG